MRPLDAPAWLEIVAQLEHDAKREARVRTLGWVLILALCLSVWTLVVTALLGAWPWA